MMFVGQIVIKKGKLGSDKNLVVYIFITHSESNKDDFFDSDIAEWNGGENAVIIQNFENSYTKSTNVEEGSTLFNQEEYFDSIDTNKIVGTPNLFREDTFPEGE